MRLAGFLLLATIGLLGCASGDDPGAFQKEPDSISIPLQQARNLYATIATIARDRMAYAQSLCTQNRLSATECLQLAKDAQVLQTLDFEVKRRLDNPKAELDTAKLLRILEISAKLIGAAT